MTLPAPVAPLAPLHGQLPAAQAMMPSGFSVSPEQKLELLEYWRSVLKRKWAILGLGMVVALVAAIFAYSLTPVYRSTATVLIEPGKVKVVSIEDVYTSNQLQGIQTQTEILKSREIAERTARALKLWELPAFDPRQAKPDWRTRLLGMLGFSSAPAPAWTAKTLEDATIGALTGRLIVEPVRASQLLRVSFESEDPALAARVVNTAVEQYIEADRRIAFRAVEAGEQLPAGPHGRAEEQP